MTGRRNQILNVFMRSAQKINLVLARINVDVVSRDDAAIDQEFMRSRATNHEWKVANPLPSVIESRPVVDHGDWLGSIVVGGLNPLLDSLDRCLNVQIAQP